MRVQLIDPSADVLFYDHALAAALARQGADVHLLTSRFVHGPVAAPDGFEVSEPFYRAGTRWAARRARLRRVLKGAEHVPGMIAQRRRAGAADVGHWQWLWLEQISARLVPRRPPQVLTLHNVIRRGGRPTGHLTGAFDAVIVHTRYGAELLGGGGNVHVIPCGAFEHLTSQPGERPLPPELAAVEGPVVLAFGVVRDYKGIDVLVEAFRDVPGAELWVVGRPLGVSMERLRALAPAGRVRFVDRYVSDAELPAYFRRADVVALPHRSVDISGVLFTGLAFHKAMVLSDVGGFSEVVHDHGAGVLVRPDDPPALAAALNELIADPGRREELERRAAAAAAGAYSWDQVAARTLDVYREVTA
jgi:glycosyltransferase involved in cell wall biosynthesis